MFLRVSSYGCGLLRMERPHGLQASVVGYDVSQDTPSVADQEICEALATKLDAAAFIEGPLGQRYQIAGRFYLTAWQRPAFDDFDVDFLLQGIERTVLALHHIRLVDR